MKSRDQKNLILSGEFRSFNQKGSAVPPGINVIRSPTGNLTLFLFESSWPDREPLSATGKLDVQGELCKNLTFIVRESPGPAQEPLFATGLANAKAGLQRKIQGHGQGNSREAHAPTGNFTFYSFLSSTSHNGNRMSRKSKRFPIHILFHYQEWL